MLEKKLSKSKQFLEFFHCNRFLTLAHQKIRQINLVNVNEFEVKVHGVETRVILSHWYFFPWNHFFSNYFSVLSRNFCQKCVRVKFCYFHSSHCEVWKNQNLTHPTRKLFRENKSQISVIRMIVRCDIIAYDHTNHTCMWL